MTFRQVPLENSKGIGLRREVKRHAALARRCSTLKAPLMNTIPRQCPLYLTPISPGGAWLEIEEDFGAAVDLAAIRVVAAIRLDILPAGHAGAEAFHTYLVFRQAVCDHGLAHGLGAHP